MSENLPGNLKEAGLVLLTALVMAIVFSIFGITVAQQITLSTHMNRNMKDFVHARQAAEAALSAGTSVLEQINDLNILRARNQCMLLADRKIVAIPIDPDLPEIWHYSSIWESLADHISDIRRDLPDLSLRYPCGVPVHQPTVSLSNVAAQPRYLLEHLVSLANPETGSMEVFRVTALGIGATQNARVLLQGTYGKTFTGEGVGLAGLTRLSWQELSANH